MNIENIQAQMRKGILEYCILAIIGKEEIYASDIIMQLKEAELIVVEGTLYPLLNRLEKCEIFNLQLARINYGTAKKILLHNGGRTNIS